MGRYENDSYVADLTFDERRAEIWQRLMQMGDDGQPVWLAAWPRMAGFDRVGDVTESLDCERLVVHKTSEPCGDSEIRITLADQGSGTAVRVVQGNLPDWVRQSVDVFVLGGDQIAADLALYLLTGLVAGRHSMPWAFAGFGGADSQAGVEIAWVLPDTCGARLGIEPGDLLVSFGGAPVVTQQCVQTILRVHQQGDEVSARWVRNDAFMEASAVL